MNSRGQIVVEYVLLLVIAVGIAAFLTKSLVSRDLDNGGVLTMKWHAIINTIGSDLPDKHK